MRGQVLADARKIAFRIIAQITISSVRITRRFCKSRDLYLERERGGKRADPRSTLTNDYAITADNSAASKQNEKYRSGWQRRLCRLLNLSSGEFVLAMRNAFAARPAARSVSCNSYSSPAERRSRSRGCKSGLRGCCDLLTSSDVGRHYFRSALTRTALGYHKYEAAPRLTWKEREESLASETEERSINIDTVAHR